MKEFIFWGLNEPEKHRFYSDRNQGPVTRKTLDKKIQFTTLRVFTIRNGRLVDYSKDLDLYTKEFRLGNVIWPIYGTIFAENFNDLIDEIKRRDLYLFDIWGYVPGASNKGSVWGEYKIEQSTYEYIVETLGDRFLGFDNGEQDGRYIGVFAPNLCRTGGSRKSCFMDFTKHFEKLGNAMMNHTVALNSLTFNHYFAREGNVTMIGAETGQALLNINLWYSFIRGAGRQYGLLWFGNASIWNRWGYKSYESEGSASYYSWGPESGTSLSLLRRLLYNEYMYNCDILGFEQGWIRGDNTEKRITGETVPLEYDESSRVLTPIGLIQRSAVEFSESYGYPGIMYTPVAIIMDFFSGWVPPRHLYSKDIYKVWGNMPYEAGDYETHNLFSLIFPGYENSGFYHDERGFISASPYGDSFNVLLSDADFTDMAGYGLVLLAGEFNYDYEFHSKLKKYIINGGTVILSIDKIMGYIKSSCQYFKDVGEFFGITSYDLSEYVMVEDAVIDYQGEEIHEQHIRTMGISITPEAEVLAYDKSDLNPIVFRLSRGKGSITVVNIEYMSVISKAAPGFSNEINMEIPGINIMANTARRLLDSELRNGNIVDINNERLSYVINIKDSSVFTILVTNSNSRTEHFDITPNGFEILGIREIKIPDIDREQRGYLPPGVVAEHMEHEINAGYAVKPYDMILLEIKCFGTKFREVGLNGNGYFAIKPHIRLIGGNIREFISQNPTFRDNFSGICVKAEYFIEKSRKFCEAESRYTRSRQLSIIVDFSTAISHYTGITLLDDRMNEYIESLDTIKDVIDKAGLYGAKTMVFKTHRVPESNISKEEAKKVFAVTFSKVTEMAGEAGMKLLLQHSADFTASHVYNDLMELSKYMNDDRQNIGFCINTAHTGVMAVEDFIAEGLSPEALFLGSASRDCFGQPYDTHDRIAGDEDILRVIEILKGTEDIIYCLDADYEDWNQAIYDLHYMRKAFSRQGEDS